MDKPKLRAELVPVYRVHHTDLNRYIEEVFGFDFDFLIATCYVEGMCPEFVVQPLPIEGESLQKMARDVRKGKKCRNVQVLLGVLHEDGYIPAGRYIIDTKKRPDPVDVYRSLLQASGNPDAKSCVDYFERHKSNPRFVERCTILDNAAREQMKRGKATKLQSLSTAA